MRKKKINKDEESIPLFFFTLLISVFIIFLLFSFFRIQERKNQFNKELQELKEKLIQLQEKRDLSKLQITQIEKESFWEEKIRKEGYVKEGEKPVVVLKQQVDKNESKDEKVRENFFQKIKEFFKIKIFH